VQKWAHHLCACPLQQSGCTRILLKVGQTSGKTNSILWMFIVEQKKESRHPTTRLHQTKKEKQRNMR
jgi:hypothetical protein